MEYERSNKTLVIKKMGEWLDGYDWKWFATLTFAYGASNETAKELYQRFINELGVNVIYFRVVEWHKYRNSAHIHALIGECDKDIIWQHGMKKVVPYCKELGARFYVAKFVSSNLAEWDFRLPDAKYAGRSFNNMRGKRMTPLKAIRSKCLSDCSCGQRSEVRNCVIPECTLFPYRFGKNPNRKGVGGKKRKVPAETMS